MQERANHQIKLPFQPFGGFFGLTAGYILVTGWSLLPGLAYFVNLFSHRGVGIWAGQPCFVGELTDSNVAYRQLVAKLVRTRTFFNL